MGSTWELKEKSTGELKATIEGELWKSAQKKAFKKLAKKVNLPGFRPGQAPEVLVKKQIDKQGLLMEAVDGIANDAFLTGIKEHDLVPVARPTLGIESIDEEKVIFKFTITVMPNVILGKYKNLDIQRDTVNVVDADIEDEIARLQERFADLIMKEEGKVENGDIAVIDFEGFVEGIAFEGGKAENYSLEIGSRSFVPGFEEKVLGMGIGETKDIDLTFPEDYQIAHLAKQPVVFKVTVHEIKFKQLPDVNDELIQQAEIENVKTVAAFKDYSRDLLEKNKKQQAEEKFEGEIFTMITEGSTVDIPDVMIEKETNALMEELEHRLFEQNSNLDQFKYLTNKTDEMIREEMSKDALKKVKVRLILEAVFAEEKLEVSEEDLNTALKDWAKNYNMPLDEFKEKFTVDAIADDLRLSKAFDFIKTSIVS